MQFKDMEFIPVILGSDINTYSVARAFYEEYGIKSYVFGKFNNGPSYQSRFIVYEGNCNMDKDEYFINRILRFADEHKTKKIIIIGCGDSYVALISKYKNIFPENMIVPYIDFVKMNNLQNKALFYELCEKHGINYPKTIIHKKEMGDEFICDFSFPVIIKPSNGIEYWEHSFDGQDKVFKPGSREEMLKILHQIYDSGYDDTVIIQDMIPGNDEYARVLTSYSDKNGKVKMMCLGHCLLEEHTPHGLGNSSVIITEYEQELMEHARKLLDDLHYVGYSIFDIKYDMRDGMFKFFEINTRQGRSNYYVTGSGFNIARYLVDDYIYNKKLEYNDTYKENLWLSVPKRLAFRYVTDPDNIEKMKKLIKDGNVVNPVFKKGDMKIMRLLRMLKNHFKQYLYFNKYCK